MSSKINLEFNGKEVELPIVEGSEGEYAIEVKSLRQQLGLITLDPGYKTQVLAKVELHSWMVKKEYCAIEVMKLTNWLKKPTFLKLRTF